MHATEAQQRYINGCIWVACAILVVGFIAVLFIGRIGHTDQLTAKINAKNYPIHDVSVEFLGGLITWTTNDNTKRCVGYWEREQLVTHSCKPIVQKSVEELREDG